jgi:hypothetical protein
LESAVETFHFSPTLEADAGNFNVRQKKKLEEISVGILERDTVCENAAHIKRMC